MEKKFFVTYFSLKSFKNFEIKKFFFKFIETLLTLNKNQFFISFSDEKISQNEKYIQKLYS
jgi:hypothetical protein